MPPTIPAMIIVRVQLNCKEGRIAYQAVKRIGIEPLIPRELYSIISEAEISSGTENFGMEMQLTIVYFLKD